MNVDARLADEMLRIDPDRVRYLSRAELNDLNLGEGSPDADVQTKASLKEAVTLKSAAAYGLSRLEYMRPTTWWKYYATSETTPIQMDPPTSPVMAVVSKSSKCRQTSY